MNAARNFLVWLVVAVFERLGIDLDVPTIEFTVGPVSNQRDDAQGVHMTIVLTNEQKVLISINPKTAAGHPAELDGDPAFVSSDPNVIAVQTTDDPKKVFVVAAGVGSAQLTVSADADLDETEVRTITGSIDFVVDQAEASDLGFEVGVPELQ
jgi:hypothetical protein